MMKFKWVYYGERLYANYWLYPCILSVLAILIAIGAQIIDNQVDLSFIAQLKIIHDIGHEGARNLLSLIASASITVASVTFSITVLTLALVSQQLGPRLLPNFMRQGRTQFVLGFFIGVFVYCLIALRSISIQYSLDQAPFVTLTLGLVLGILMFFVLIYFIHYVCHAIQVDYMLDFLTKDSIAAIRRQFAPRESNQLMLTRTEVTEAHIKARYPIMTALRSDQEGYIQTIDHPGLQALAEEQDIVIHTLFRPGHYVFSNVILLNVFSQPGSKALADDHSNQVCEDLAKKIMQKIKLYGRKSTVQDIEFGLEQLNEVAVRALSPGINNPYTAINCLDKFAQIIAILNNYKIHCDIYYDQQQQVRLIANSFTYTSVVNTALDRLRQQAKTDVSVAMQFINNIVLLFELPLVDELKSALLSQAKMMFEACCEANLHPNDLDKIKQSYDKLSGF